MQTDNPMGTDGFEFVEFTAPEPARLGAVFEMMGFGAVGRHRSKNVLRFRQGDINFILNMEPAEPGRRTSAPRTGPPPTPWRSGSRTPAGRYEAGARARAPSR